MNDTIPCKVCGNPTLPGHEEDLCDDCYEKQEAHEAQQARKAKVLVVGFCAGEGKLEQKAGMNFTANYNTDPNIFRSAAESYIRRGIFLQVVKGHVFAGSDGCVARFESDADACKCLEAAGYVAEELENIVYRPVKSMDFNEHIKLRRFKERYGKDFEKKLPMYRTASHNGRWAAIQSVDTEAMTARVRFENTVETVSIFELDNFIL